MSCVALASRAASTRQGERERRPKRERAHAPLLLPCQPSVLDRGEGGAGRGIIQAVGAKREPPPEAVAEAKNTPGGWVYEMEPRWTRRLCAARVDSRWMEGR